MIDVDFFWKFIDLKIHVIKKTENRFGYFVLYIFLFPIMRSLCNFAGAQKFAV